MALLQFTNLLLEFALDRELGHSLVLQLLEFFAFLLFLSFPLMQTDQDVKIVLHVKGFV
jgi:hypothetical protein